MGLASLPPAGPLYAGRVSEGVSAFQAKLLKVIKDFCLSERRFVHPTKSGVHPDNREALDDGACLERDDGGLGGDLEREDVVPPRTLAEDDAPEAAAAQERPRGDLAGPELGLLRRVAFGRLFLRLFAMVAKKPTKNVR